MSHTTLLRHPSLETSSSASEGTRPSLFDAKDEFIERIAPFAMAAFYFGSFSLTPENTSLARQALFKLSFLHRQFLQPGGLRIVVEKHTAVLSGTLANPSLLVMAGMLARQIEDIRETKDETTPREAAAPEAGDRDAIELLFATDQTLRSGVKVVAHESRLLIEGEVTSTAQKNWALQLAQSAGGTEIESKLKVGSSGLPITAEPPVVDDESLQALVLFRLRLVRETEHLTLKVKASRGVVALQGKVRTEALRQKAENIARSTLGVRELRSTLSIAG